MEEIWKPAIYIKRDGTVIDFSDIAEISNRQKLKIFNYHKTNKDKIIDYSKKNTNVKYMTTVFIKEGIYYGISIHRLVISSFCPESDTYECINHKDEDTHNNKLENLEWCTVKYNSNYGTRNQKESDIQRNDKKKSKPILQYDLDGNFIKEWPSGMEIKRQLGYSLSSIGNCCKRKKRFKSPYGYIWRYAV